MLGAIGHCIVSERKGGIMDQSMVTTAFELTGFKVVRNFGLVRGIVVRSLGALGSMGAAFKQIAGGNITQYTKLCEQTRLDAYQLMIQHAQQMGANALVAVRYDATEVTSGVTEVLCYGTAVQVVPDQR